MHTNMHTNTEISIQTPTLIDTHIQKYRHACMQLTNTHIQKYAYKYRNTDIHAYKRTNPYIQTCIQIQKL